MKIDELEGVTQRVNERAGESAFNISLMAGIDAQMKAVQDFADGPSLTAGEQLTFLADLRQLLAGTTIHNDVAQEYIEKLYRSPSQTVGQPQAAMWQELAAPELAAVRLFAHRDELTVDDVRKTTTSMAEAVPIMLERIRDRMAQAPEAERFDLKKERVALQEELIYYERLLSVLDKAFPQAERLKWQEQALATAKEQPLPQDLLPLTADQLSKLENEARGIPMIGVPPENSVSWEKYREEQALQYEQFKVLRGNIFQVATFVTLNELIPGHTREAIQASRAVGDLAKAIGGTLGTVPQSPTPVGGGRPGIQ